MTLYKKEIVITEEEWTHTLNAYWQAEVEDWGRDGTTGRGDQALDHFYHSGNIENYFKEALAAGINPAGIINWVPVCNPQRNFDLFFHNLNFLWSWVSANPSERTPQGLGIVKQDMSEKLVALVKGLGRIDTPFLDPVCSAKLFKMVFGDTYRRNNVFPIPLGPEQRQVEVIVEPDEMFVGLMASIGNYLFSADSSIRDRQSIATVDYWLSTLPLVTDKRVFDKEYHEVEGVRSWYKRQMVLRGLLANLYGYNVYADEGPVLSHHDIEMEDYLREKLAAPNMPPELRHLIEFVHEHKENCLNVGYDDE